MRLRGGSSHGAGRFVAVAIATAVVAEIAVLLLAPEPPESEPATPAAESYFSAEEIEAGRDFRFGQRNLGLLALVIDLGALGLLVAGRPSIARRAMEWAGRRPLLGAAAVGGAISLFLAVLAIPLGLVAHERAVDVGLSTQDAAGWLADRARSAGIGLLIAAAGGLILVALQRRMPRLWWLAGSSVVIGYAVVTTWLAPVVLAPAFNDFEPLPEGDVRARVLDLAERAGVDVGEVYAVDASRRGTSLNAYVDGLGSSKRVVLYDNLIDEADRAELESVVAHELGHVAANDLIRGLSFVALVAPLGVLTVALGGAGLARAGGALPGTPAAIPAYALVLALVAFAIGLAGSQLSRKVEASADDFALRLTGDPQGFIDLQTRLATTNLADPDPSNPVDRIMRTHPSTVDRIGAAIAFRRR